jgi:prolyl-tRNA synthetase
MVLMRGDHQLNEMKLEGVLGTGVFRPATNDEIRPLMGADVGSLGPVGITGIRILADTAIEGRRNMTTGANKDDYHIQGVTPGVHFHAEYHNLRTVRTATVAPLGGKLSVHKSIEVGHIFKLGTKYSVGPAGRGPGRRGQATLSIMGTTLGWTDPDLRGGTLPRRQGDHFPCHIAPFQVIITPISMEDSRLVELGRACTPPCRPMGWKSCTTTAERPGVSSRRRPHRHSPAPHPGAEEGRPGQSKYRCAATAKNWTARSRGPGSGAGSIACCGRRSGPGRPAGVRGKGLK